MDKKIEFISSRQNSLWKENGRERILSQRSSKALSQSVHIVEENIRDVKRQLTQAVSLFRKQRQKVPQSDVRRDEEDLGSIFRQSVMKDISSTLGNSTS